jgi:hypothetical protein
MEAEMLKIWDATNFRRTVGGLCLILAPLLHFAGERLAPSNTGTASDWLAAASQDSGRNVESIILILVSGILMIPALFAIAHVVRGRGVILAHIGVGVTLVAVVLDTFVSAGANLMVAVMGSAGLDSGAMTGLIQKSLTAPSVVSTPIFIGFFLQLPGYFLIGLAVWRSGFGYRWAGPLVSLWVVAAFFNPVQSDILEFVIDALGVVALGAIGYRVLALKDTVWESASTPSGRPSDTSVPNAQPVAGD